MRPSTLGIETVLFAVGYPAAVTVIARFVPVVRRRRWRWLAAHHVAVVAIAAGWAIEGRGGAVAVNGTWLVASSLWYAAGGRVLRPGPRLR
ncbi:MAG: hypothetical protein ACRD1K_04160 [Acidimicrobiales bacterium]